MPDLQELVAAPASQTSEPNTTFYDFPAKIKIQPVN
jgi:hypothetical protein